MPKHYLSLIDRIQLLVSRELLEVTQDLTLAQALSKTLLTIMIRGLREKVRNEVRNLGHQMKPILRDCHS